MLLSSAEDTRKCETTERISAGALGWHLSQYKKPITMKWRSSRWQRCHLKMVLLACPSDDKAWLWALAACSILRKLISFPCQKTRMCYLILPGHGTMSHLMTCGDAPQLYVDRPGYQPSSVSTVPNTGRNLSNSNYGGLDEEEEGMGCGKSFFLGGRHRTVNVMNWNVPQLFSYSKWNPHFISANITEERYPLYDYASVFRNTV